MVYMRLHLDPFIYFLIITVSPGYIYKPTYRDPPLTQHITARIQFSVKPLNGWILTFWERILLLSISR